jgi:hypothetical protein
MYYPNWEQNAKKIHLICFDFGSSGNEHDRNNILEDFNSSNAICNSDEQEAFLSAIKEKEEGEKHVHMRLRTREIQKALEKLHKKKNCLFVP